MDSPASSRCVLRAALFQNQIETTALSAGVSIAGLNTCSADVVVRLVSRSVKRASSIGLVIFVSFSCVFCQDFFLVSFVNTRG